jgi:putative peptidoglycan lipid II flippase
MPVRIGIASVVLNLALNLLFMVPLQHVGPALASSLAAWANVIALAWVLHKRRQFLADDLLIGRAIRIASASVVMALVVYGLQKTEFAALAGHGNVARSIGLAIEVGGGMAVYGVAGQVLGAFDARVALGRIARRVRGSRPKG